MLIKLPNGLIDGGDHFNMARIDELRGKQQNYLSNKELVIGNIGHVPKILEDLVKSLETEHGLAWQGNLKEAINKLPVGDLETILLRIRENTFGPKYYHDSECPHCKHLNKDLRIDLDKLDLDVMSLADMMNSSSRTIMLTKSKIEVELKPLYLKDLFDAVKMATGKQDELVTTTLALSIKRMGDKSKVTSADLSEMPVTDIMDLNNFAENIKLEGSIDTDVITECTNCKKEFEYKLNVYDPSFFYPTKGFKSTSS
jgi:hypothetical protein